MSFGPTGRVGLSAQVSGFVTHEPRSLGQMLAQAGRAAQEAIAGWCSAVLPERSAKEAAPPEPLLLPETVAIDFEAPPVDPAPVEAVDIPHAADLEAAAPAAEARRRLQGWRIHAAAALIRGRQLGVLAIAGLRAGERLRDFATLVWVVARWLLVKAWRMPLALKAVVVVAIGLALAPWPEDMPLETQDGPASIAAATPARTVDPWRTVTGVIPAYNLEAAELDRNALKYRARRHVDGTRQDMITWHEDGEEGPRPKSRLSGALAVEQPGREGIRQERLFVEIARRAAIVGNSIERMSDPFVINNKFGAVETADVTIFDGNDARNCLAFRHAAQNAPIQLLGWFCGTQQKPLDRQTLACLLDRVDLIGGGDQRVRAYFAATERARQTCGTYRSASLPAGWVDSSGRIPELKTSFREPPRR